MVHEVLSQEYKLARMVREEYFKVHKKFLSLGALSREIGSRDMLRSHFFTKRTAFFRPFIIFTIEQWCKKNLPNNVKRIQKEIDEWRKKHDDSSVYAKQDTPLRRIAHNLLLLHYQQKDELLLIKTLDLILYNEKMGFSAEFFGSRVSRSPSLTVTVPLLLLLKVFVNGNYDGRRTETKQLIKDIDDYIKISADSDKKGVLKSHTEGFSKIKPFQLKHLTDITKGLDVMRCQFFTKEEQYILSKKGGVTRHHIGEDSWYDYMIYVYDDGGMTKYLVKIAPLGFLSSHMDIHDSLHSFTGMANDIVEARMRHLCELDKIEFDSTIPEDERENYYFKIFREEFRSQKDYIWHFKSEKNIWGEFVEGKVGEMTDVMIEKYVDRWIKSKEVSEQSWYDSYYERFYKERYIPFMKDIYAYMRDRSIDPNILETDLCKWFIETYLRDEPLFDFYDKPLDSFINNI